MSGENQRSWGQFVEEVADERALEAFEGAEPYTTAEIAESMNATEHTARSKLEELAEEGVLERKVLRGEAAPLTVWYLPREAHAGADPRNTAAGVEDPEERADELIEGFDVPGTSEMMRDWRRDAVRAAYEHLREHGTVEAGEFREEVYPGHAAGYDEPQPWWAMVRERLKELPGVSAPAWGGETWEYEAADSDA